MYILKLLTYDKVIYPYRVKKEWFVKLHKETREETNTGILCKNFHFNDPVVYTGKILCKL